MSYFVMCANKYEDAHENIYSRSVGFTELEEMRRGTTISIRGPFTHKGALEYVKQQEDDTYIKSCCKGVHFILESIHVAI